MAELIGLQKELFHKQWEISVLLVKGVGCHILSQDRIFFSVTLVGRLSIF